MMGYPDIVVRPTGRVVCRRHPAVVRRHHQGALARLRAARRPESGWLERTIAWLADAAGPWRDPPLEARAQPEVVYVLPKSSAACSATSQSAVASPAGLVPLCGRQDAERPTRTIVTIDEPLGADREVRFDYRLPNRERSRRAAPARPSHSPRPRRGRGQRLDRAGAHVDRRHRPRGVRDQPWRLRFLLRPRRPPSAHDRRVGHLYRTDGPAASRAAARSSRLDFPAALRRRYSRGRPAARIQAGCGCCTSAGCRKTKASSTCP